jgi:hypothetical protein
MIKVFGSWVHGCGCAGVDIGGEGGRERVKYPKARVQWPKLVIRLLLRSFEVGM